jgi:hypothetical protein
LPSNYQNQVVAAVLLLVSFLLDSLKTERFGVKLSGNHAEMLKATLASSSSRGGRDNTVTIYHREVLEGMVSGSDSFSLARSELGNWLAS